MHSQVNNQIANSLASAENLVQALYLILDKSRDDDAKVVETLVEKLHGDLQTARAAFEALSPEFLQ